jgi:hypothetical protein
MSQWFPTFQKIQQTPLRDLVRLQVSGRLNWKARIAESGLPEIARQKITDVIKATRLWRLEKSQIADELIAHFQDGQRRGLDVSDLVSRFGETEPVARLMRAAKKRNRSLAWKTFMAGCYAFVAFLVLYAGVAIWFFSGSPNPKVDYYKVVSSAAVSVPEEQRAWPVYRDAWLEHEFANLNIPRTVGQKEEDESWNSWRPGDKKWSGVVALLEEQESLIEAFRSGGQMPGLGLEIKRRGDYSSKDERAIFGQQSDDAGQVFSSNDFLLRDALIGALLEHVQKMRTMSRLLEVDVFRHAKAGRAELVTEDLLAMLGLGPQAAEAPFLVCSLVGIALDSTAFLTIEELVTDYPDLLSEDQLETISRKLSLRSSRDLVSYDGEIAFQKDLIQRIYTDDGSGDGRLTDEGLLALSKVNASVNGDNTRPDPLFSAFVNVVGPGVALFTGSRKDLEGAVENAMEEWSAAVEPPFFARKVRGPEYFDDLINRHASGNYAATIFMMMLMPAMDQVASAGERAESRRRAKLLGVAACRHRLKHGEFPSNADDLVPDFLESVPLDPITGNSLQYRLDNGQPVIYSVGADGDDDGGVQAVDSAGNIVEDGARHFSQSTSNEVEGDWILWPAR